MSRLIRGLAALGALLLVLFGVPAALVALGGDPFPSRLTWSGLWLALRTPDDGTILVGLVTILGWLAWFVFALSVFTELVRLLSHERIQLRLPGLGGPQRLAAGLLLSITALLAVPQLAHAPAPLPTVAPPPATAPPAAPAHSIEAETGGPSPPGSGPAGSRLGDASDAVASAVPMTGPSGVANDPGQTHLVRQGDDLWSLAEHYYGQGRDWRRIAAANPEVLTGGPDRLEPGWRLQIPGARTAPDRGADEVTVKRGDSLSSIAENQLGSAARWPALYRSNQAQLSDPDELVAGMRLTLPRGTPLGDDQGGEGEPDTERAARPEAPAEQAHPDADPVPTRPVPTRPTPTRPAPRASDAARPSSSAPSPSAPSASAPSPSEPGSSGSPSAATAPPGSAPTAAEPARADGRLPEHLAAPLSVVGGLLAAGLLAGLAARRRLQLQARPVGRRVPHPPLPAQRVEAGLGRRQRPVSLRTLDRASRAIAAHCLASGSALPGLQYALVGGEHIELVLTTPHADAPVGFTVRGRSWLLHQGDAEYLGSVPGLSEAPRPWPALATLGRDAQDRLVVADLETMGLLGLQSSDTGAAAGVLAGLAVELSFSPWADEMVLTVVGGPLAADQPGRLPGALGRHNVGETSDIDALLDRLEKRAAVQRAQLAQVSLDRRRIDPDLADPWAPEIVLIETDLNADQWIRLTDVLTAEPRVTMAAVVIDPPGATPWRLDPLESDAAVLEPVGLALTPQYLDRPTAAAVVDLVATTGSDDTTSAPWWAPESARPPQSATGPPPARGTFLERRTGGWGLDGARLTRDDARQGPSSETDQGDESRAGDEFGAATECEAAEETTRTEGARMRAVAAALVDGGQHPMLRLLGPVELVDPAGSPPPRAGKQCLEYCAWLLEHPGTTAQAMANALVVAEGTRRSNMSRLRSWLGSDPAGEPYLPDAYTGRILLHPDVSSDWLHLQVLTTGGVNRAGDDALRAALDLVRGAPLADAAPGQWHWAEELRTDMISCLRDVGVELANRSLNRGDLDLARWAASRALVAAPGDELLMTIRIRTEHRAGNPAETERLTLQLAAQARSLGVDLEVETVILLQEVMEGRVRARMA